MRDVKIFTDNVESTAIYQIQTLMDQPAFADCKIRIMPDVHAGKGCVIGFTADLGDKVIPNIVGVDIGCGMLSVCLGKIDIDYEWLDQLIREQIPSGRNVHDHPSCGVPLEQLRCFRQLRNVDWIERSMGTLGGGNHFIEIDENGAGYKILIIHSGSRNLGKQVAEIYQKKAIDSVYEQDICRKRDKIIETYKRFGRENEISKALEELKKTYKQRKEQIPKDLCYLTGDDRQDYLHDMKICQRFARLNRMKMAIVIQKAIEDRYGVKPFSHADLQKMIGESATTLCFETIHNYIDFDTNIVRKGAISAKEGELLLIPLNMRDGCIIGRGKGNPDWNYSAPHGAGRVMSRRRAREILSVDEFKDRMAGIYTTSINEQTIDESPMAYKPAQEILDSIEDTVEVVEIIKPVYNFKASE